MAPQSAQLTAEPTTSSSSTPASQPTELRQGATTFSNFSKLIPELRIKIWKMVANQGRVVPVWVSYTGIFASSSAKPAIMSVSHEAREEAMKSSAYNNIFESLRDISPDFPQTPVWVNSNDLICPIGVDGLAWSPRKYGVFCDLLPLTNVQRIGLNDYTSSDYHQDGMHIDTWDNPWNDFGGQSDREDLEDHGDAEELPPNPWWLTPNIREIVVYTARRRIYLWRSANMVPLNENSDGIISRFQHDAHKARVFDLKMMLDIVDKMQALQLEIEEDRKKAAGEGSIEDDASDDEQHVPGIPEWLLQNTAAYTRPVITSMLVRQTPLDLS